MQTSLSPALDREPAIIAAARPSRRVRADVWGLAAIYVIAVAVYVFLGTRQPIPFIAPDEFTYGQLATSLAHGDGLTLYGAPMRLIGALYVYAIAPFWTLDSGTTAYALTKIFGALTLSMVCVPVWWLSRTLAGPRVAVLSAALAVGGVWMTVSGFALTEVLAIPLAAAALAAMVVTVRRPGSRWAWFALALIFPATWARLQLLVLLPVFVLVLGGDCIRNGPERRTRLHAHRVPLIASSALLLVGMLFVAVDTGGALGSYGGITSQHPSFTHAVSRTAETGVGLVALSGFVPVALALAFASRREAWRDDTLGPLLLVGGVSSLLFVLEAGWFTAGQPTHWHIERYVAYTVPLLIVLSLVGVQRRFADWRTLIASSSCLVIACLLMPGLGNVLEERAYYASSLRFHQLFGAGDQLGLALAAALAGGAVAIALRKAGRRGSTALTATAAVMATVFAIQSEASWQWQVGVIRTARSAYASNLGWLTAAAGSQRDVAELLSEGATPVARVNAFLNPVIDRIYANPRSPAQLQDIGRPCTWNPADDGLVQFSPSCGAVPHKLLLATRGLRVTFRDERLVADEGPQGRLITVAGHPRLLAVVGLSCGGTGIVYSHSLRTIAVKRVTLCTGAFAGSVYPSAAATLRIVYRGGSREHYVAVNDRPTRIAPAAQVIVDVPIEAPAVPYGQQAFRVSEDWTSAVGAPEVVRADLIEPGQTQRVL